jgi:predicted SAM-dependent methyltransferase
MPAIRNALKKNPFIYLLGKELKSTVRVMTEEVRHRSWKRRRQLTIANYLASSAEPKLHIGCGPMVMEGWLNTDLEPLYERGVIYLDVTERLPFPDNSFDYIYSEHLIEHIPLDAALRHLRDCHRILKPGGVVRLSTPDLKFLLDYFRGANLSDVQQAYLTRVIDESYPGLSLRSPTLLLNQFVRDWGHQFIYDRQLLQRVLELAGFAGIVHCGVKQSAHPALAHLEWHGSAISEPYNELQSMILEGTKSIH